MLIVEDSQIINPLNLSSNNVHVSNRWQNEIISKDMEVISKQYNDIYNHFFLPFSRQQISFNKSWVKEAQSLFPAMRSLSEEETDTHLKGIKRVFKSTGRNLHNYDW